MRATKGIEARRFNSYSKNKDIKRPYIAEITGIENGRFAKSFLKSKTDFSESNGKGSSGIFFWFILGENKIYEVRECVSWKNQKVFYIKTDEKGNIEQIAKTEVYECIKSI